MLLPLTLSDPAKIGNYTLLRRLPSGGMADVFLGQAPNGQLFAIKVVKPDPTGILTQRFPAELKAARRAHGRYIAEIDGMDRHAVPPWLAMEYVAGPSLREAVRSTGPLPTASVRALGAGLCEALI